MCAEGLSAMLRSNVESGLIHGCTVARGAPNISHLFFADDCYLFFRATEVEAVNMKRILNIYESISGQQINFGKSTVVFSPNTKVADRTKVCDKLGVTEIATPGNYLGLPMVVSRNRVATFSFLPDRVDQKLQAWGNKTLSKAGKVLLLKTSAQTVPNFWMSLMLIPLEVCEGIQKKFNAFWWGTNRSNRGIRWLSWDKLCQVKEAGGLGFKKLREFNIAMLAKQAWRLINNCNPVVTALMKTRYYPRSEFLNAEIGNNPSYIWRSIIEARDVVRKGVRRKIEDGKSTLIWQDPWFPCAQNGCMTTERYPQLEHTTVDQLMDEAQMDWDDEILEELFNERDRSLMKQVHIPIRKRNDSWYWLFDDSGRYTVRSCYRKIVGEIDCPDRGLWNKIWSLKLPEKVVNFIWRMCKEVLPTAANLITKHVMVVDRCAWCHNNVEDSLHVLFQCEFAVQVWTEVGMCSLLSVMPGDTVLQVTKRVLSTGNKTQEALFGMICWALWYKRNKWIWERVTMSVFGVKSMALNMQSDWNKAREVDAQRETQRQRRVNTWCKPPIQWIKINMDAACNTEGGLTGLRCVIRDDAGQFIRARSKKLQAIYQPRVAEAISLREALSWTKEWRSSRCVFETDAKVLVDAINTAGDKQGCSTFDTIVDDCRELIKHFEEVLISFVPRSANSVAHLLAKGAYSMPDVQEWLITEPDFIRCNLALEAL